MATKSWKAAGRVLTAAAVLAGGAIAGVNTTAQAAGGLIISEVSPWASGNSPYGADWFELTNTGSAAVGIGGWKMDDDSNNFANAVALNGVTSIGAGESVVFIETTSATKINDFRTFWGIDSSVQIGMYNGSGVGLGTGGDAVSVFNATGALQARVTFGASPSAAPYATFDNAAGVDNAAIGTLSVAGTNGAWLVASPAAQAAIGSPGTIGTGGGDTSTSSSSTTTTTTVPSTLLPWPGAQTSATASTYKFNTNLSGLVYEGSGSAAPGVIWAVRNGPGTLFKLVWNGTTWAPAAGEWASGKALRYAGGTGDPDSEGVTFTAAGPNAGIFVATERNNSSSGTSRNAVLRFDPTAAGTTLTATMEWNLTSSLPTTGANLGAEAITWVPDTYLVANGFIDQTTNAVYNPANYPDHGDGLFVVGLEANGMAYAFALGQTTGSINRIASFTTGLPAVMDLSFDRETNKLWAVCDDTCQGQHNVLTVDAAGAFTVSAKYARPTELPNVNNEGFALAPLSECTTEGKRPAFWADDNETNGVSLRSGWLNCEPTPPGEEIPEFPMPALATLAAAGLALVVIRRRRNPVTA